MSDSKPSLLADSIIKASGINNNAYLIDLENGTMTRAQFVASQEQFFFAVSFFSRPMAGLLARIPDPKKRLAMLHNLVEEHGDFNERAFHHSTFLEFLRRMGSDVSKVEKSTLAHPSVRAFNSALACACVLDEPEVGIGVMGIIECAFADISSRIGHAVIARGWLTQEEMIHYSLHAEIDPRHAQEFFDLIDDAQGDDFINAVQGMRMGAYIFDQLYLNLPRGN